MTAPGPADPPAPHPPHRRRACRVPGAAAGARRPAAVRGPAHRGPRRRALARARRRPGWPCCSAAAVASPRCSGLITAASRRSTSRPGWSSATTSTPSAGSEYDRRLRAALRRGPAARVAAEFERRIAAGRRSYAIGDVTLRRSSCRSTSPTTRTGTTVRVVPVRQRPTARGLRDRSALRPAGLARRPEPRRWRRAMCPEVSRRDHGE